MARFSDPASRDGDLTLLAIGDIHLGTRPSSLPDEISQLGVELRDLTPEAALNAAVDRAIDDSVDAVLLAGDVVESSNARFEALRPLESAVRRLLEARIPVLAVAGNHDVEALPRLARMIEGFELLGEGGRWQSRVIEKNGRPAVEILGWSFPERQVRSSPIAELLRRPLEPAHPGVPRIALLHGDLDAAGGSYAPFTRNEIAQASLDAWLLGHSHKPSLPEGKPADGSAPFGYLGSLVGLDPSETGPHGPWLVQVSAAGEIVPRQLPIAPLRWERFDLHVAVDEEPEDVGDRLLEAAVRFAREIQAQDGPPRALGLRPRLVGATQHFDALRRKIESGAWNGLHRWAEDTLVFLDKLQNGLDLAHDLRELARGNDPPALLARKLLILGSPGEERSALLDAARGALQGLVHEARWSALDQQRDPDDPLSDDALLSQLTRSGTAALNELISQRGVDAESDS